jgi:hypothetical protein
MKCRPNCPTNISSKLQEMYEDNCSCYTGREYDIHDRYIYSFKCWHCESNSSLRSSLKKQSLFSI